MAVSVVLALAALLYLGGALPDIDRPSDDAQRRASGIAFAFLAALALPFYHVAQGVSPHRILVETSLVFLVFLLLGLVLSV